MSVLLAAFLLVLAPLLPPAGESGVLAGVAALAVLAWCVSRGTGRGVVPLQSLRIGIRPRRQRTARRGAVLRQSDPDAPGRPRPRAPGTSAVVQATA